MIRQLSLAAALGVWAFASTPTACAATPLSGRYTTATEGEVTYDATGIIGSGSSAIRSFSVRPAANVAGVVIEYRGRFAGQGETDWVTQGKPLSKGNADLQAVSFRLTGPNAEKYRLEYSVASELGALSGLTGKWTSGGGGSVVLIVACLIAKVEAAAISKLPEVARHDRANSETARKAEERKRQGAPVTATVLSAVGGVLGFVYGGPQGAFAGAVFGYALGEGLEKGVITFAANAKLPSMKDIYKKATIESAAKEWTKSRDRLYEQLSEADKKIQDTIHEYDPTKHGKVKIGELEIELPKPRVRITPF